MKVGLIREKANTPGMGSLYIVYDGSSNVETSGNRGLSHLWEHLKCHSYDHLQEALMAAGVVSNAYTSDRNVVYHWTGLDDKIEQYQEELLKLITYVPTAEQFENEKKIVMQEYEDCVANQSFIFSNISRKYFNDFGPIGYRDDIVNITYEKFMEFSNTNFPNPMQIIRVGDSKIDELVSEQTYFKNDTITQLKELLIPDDTFVESPSKFSSVTMADWIYIPKFIIPNNALAIITASFARDLSSPLYQEIREKRGLVYRCGLYLEQVDRDNTTVFFSAGCQKESIEEIRKVFRDIVFNWKEYVTKERFDSVVELLRNKTRMSDIANHNSVSKHFHSEDENITFEYLNTIDYSGFESYFESFRYAVINRIHFGHSEQELYI